jgi:hypothetical protein
MLRYLPLLIVLGLILYCFFDVLLLDRRRFRTMGKFAWLLVVLLPVIGAILWLAVGRPRHRAQPHQESVIHLRRRERIVAPDDDPEFLKVLNERAWRAKRDALKPPERPAAHPPAGSDAPAQPGPLESPPSDHDDAPPAPRTGE